jgi:ligand-binding sensor domain-containing protein/DNA-binding CsgD family transcriptional regulator
MKHLVFALAILLFLQPALAFQGKYPIQHFTPKDYKAGIQNIDFAQNRDMTLFVANNLGVLAFNGKDWDVHAFQTGKKERSLAFDERTGRLYAGSQGEFGYFEKGWQYVSLVDLIPAAARDLDEVWDVFVFNSNVYFCTFKGLYVYDGRSISIIRPEGGLNRSFLASGKLFTQNAQGRLLEVREQELVPSFPQNLRKQIIAGIVPEAGGYLLFYNSGDIEFTNAFGVAPKYGDLAEVLRGTYVNHVIQLSDTRLAISTQTSGLFLYDMQQQTLENITAEEGLLSNACLRAFQDASGNLWVGMQNGIALIYLNSPMRFINQDINLQGSGYEAVEADEGVYYTTSNGIYFQAKNSAKSAFMRGTEGPAYGMQRIADKLYAGHHTGLFLLENGKARRVAYTDGLWQVKQLRANPRYAIGGAYSGLYLFRIGENRELQVVQKIAGFNESSRFFEEDQKGRIWVGQFYKGLYQLDLTEDLTGAKINQNLAFPAEDQVTVSNIDNELYFATRENLYRLDQSTDRIVEEEVFSKEIGDHQVYLLAQDKQKNIHVFAENLVGYFKPVSANKYTFVRSSLYQLRYSVNNDLLNLSVNIGNGVLFNANEGFIYYDPKLENQLSVEKPLVVSKVYSVAEDSLLYARLPFGEKPEDIARLVVSPRAKVLQFAVESFQFNNAGNQQFRYFLQGFDEKYGEWTSAPVKEYTNLREGEYAFVVQTRNDLGEIVTSQPLLLKVRPPFHRRLLVRVFYVILGISALLLVSMYQKRRYRRKAKIAEQARQQRLSEIEQQKEQEVLQLEKAKVESELHYLNNLLAATTMNLVVKNEFIENIKEELQEARQKSENREMKQALEKIVKEIESTLRLQEDWEQFERHFDQVHGDFLARLRNQFDDLTPNEQKLCAFLRLNLSTKEISNLMSISLRGVEVARYRLRKKLGLQQGDNLTKFILEY